MAALRHVCAIFAVLAAASPACVIKLSDTNLPLTNGGVTGPAADCARVTPEAHGAPGGDAKPKFVGRYDVAADGKARFDWSGDTISARFQGTQVSFGLDTPVALLFSAIVDGGPEKKITVTSEEKGLIPIATGLADGPHEVVLVRNSEALYGPATFTGFDFGGGTLLPPNVRPRRIEIIGDSITCGYGDEGTNATCPFDLPLDPKQPDLNRVPVSENIYLAYGSLVARELDADITTLCYSGKGVYQNYRERGVGEGPAAATDAPDPDAKTTIPLYYQRTIASQGDAPAWDFTKDVEPQVVVMNVGTNDFARDLNQDSIADGIDLVKFHDAYAAFVATVRQLRPNAHIFLALPPMVTDKFPLDDARSNFRNALKTIVSELNARGDAKVYFVELVEMGTAYGLGCDYHPNLTVHRIMADQLKGAIQSKTCW